MTAVALLHAGHSTEPAAWLPVLAIGVITLLIGTRAGTMRRLGSFTRTATLGGLLALAVALSPPLDQAGESLLTAHMVQHLVLMLVAAPLLALGKAEAYLATLLPHSPRRHLHRKLNLTGLNPLLAPFIAWLLFGAALWLWHVPAFYEAAVHQDLAHITQHVAFLVPAWFFWRTTLTGTTSRRAGFPLAAVLLFTTMVHSNALAGMLVFASEPWYSTYVTAGETGLTALQDQQLAGVLMWVSGTPVLLGGLLWLAYRWLTGVEAENPDLNHSAMLATRVETTG